MADVGPATEKKGLFEGANALVALISAVVGVWGAYTTVQVNRNADKLKDVQAQLSALKDERDWAKHIYAEYDKVVAATDGGEQVRIDRLAGLLMLAQLVDEGRPELKATAVSTISGQISNYKLVLQQKQAKAPTPEGQAQLEQYKNLERQAQVAVAPWGVLFGTDSSVAAASDEIKRVQSAGFADARLFEVNGKYVSVALFSAEADAKAALPAIRRISPTAKDARPIRIETWCRADSYAASSIPRCKR